MHLLNFVILIALLAASVALGHSFDSNVVGCSLSTKQFTAIQARDILNALYAAVDRGTLATKQYDSLAARGTAPPNSSMRIYTFNPDPSQREQDGSPRSSLDAQVGTSLNGSPRSSLDEPDAHARTSLEVQVGSRRPSLDGKAELPQPQPRKKSVSWSKEPDQVFPPATTGGSSKSVSSDRSTIQRPPLSLKPPKRRLSWDGKPVYPFQTPLSELQSPSSSRHNSFNRSPGNSVQKDDQQDQSQGRKPGTLGPSPIPREDTRRPPPRRGNSWTHANQGYGHPKK
ncbi:hypothetical protein Hypma_014509 [Hypsizygus marmoreus]|uniref:Uncharacterized protein n=1 Tax=Hypsizygus marmoreus TaxID=39966 RepID=A0A369J9Q9_HYPMA|nr:hypothetical protein Hypma_014509 [Hypsizygus marmoreus]